MTRREQAAETLAAAGALTVAYGRMRIRELRILLFNPLAVVFALVATSGYIWVLVSQGEVLATNPSATQPYIAGIVFGLCIISVALTAQRGSPLRLQPGDIAWALQSRQGPAVILLVHGVGSALLAFFGASVGAATALVLREESPLFGPVSGLAVMTVLLVLRATSLGAHLVGQSRSRRTRMAGIAALIVVTGAWAASSLSHVLGLGEKMWLFRALTEVTAAPFRVVLEPELGDLRVSLALLLLAVLVLSVVIARARSFVEPAVHESILANQLQKVLSGGKVAPLQGRGYKTGLSSWSRWPAGPLAAVLASHLAQARRRRVQYIGTAVVLNVVVLVPIFLQEYIPAATGLIIALLILTFSSPSQPAATELDHQHLLLAHASLARIGFAGICLNALLDLLVCAPAMVLGVSLYLGSPFWGVVSLVPVALFTMSSSLAGVASRALSDAPLGRAFVALILAALPLLIAITAVLSYGEELLAARLWLTVSGTMLVSAALNAGITIAVFVSVRPGRYEQEQRLVSNPLPG